MDLADRQAVIDACYRYAAAVDRTAKDPSDDAFAAYADTMTARLRRRLRAARTVRGP